MRTKRDLYNEAMADPNFRYLADRYGAAGGNVNDLLSNPETMRALMGNASNAIQKMRQIGYNYTGDQNLLFNLTGL